jgi:hypothetical protein
VNNSFSSFIFVLLFPTKLVMFISFATHRDISTLLDLIVPFLL